LSPASPFTQETNGGTHPAEAVSNLRFDVLGTSEKCVIMKNELHKFLKEKSQYE
jgi:hypothetical protein